MVHDEGSSSSVTSSPLHNFSTMPLHPSAAASPTPPPPWLMRELRSDERGLCLIHLLLNCAAAASAGRLDAANAALEHIAALAARGGGLRGGAGAARAACVAGPVPRAAPAPRDAHRGGVRGREAALFRALPVPPPGRRRRQPVHPGGDGVGEDRARRRPRRRGRHAVARAAPPPGGTPGGPAAPAPHRRLRAQGRADPDGDRADEGGRAAGRALPVQPRGHPPRRARRGVPPREDRGGAGHHLQPPAALPPRLRRRHHRQGQQQEQQQGQQQARQPGVRSVPVDVARGRVPGRAVGPVAEGDGGDGAGGEPQRGGPDGAVRGGAQLLRGAVRLPGGGGAARVRGARARRAVDARRGDQEHRGLRRRRAPGATRAARPLGAADGGRGVRPRAAQLLRAAAGAAHRAGPRLRRVQGARGERVLLPLLAGPRHLLRLRMARPPIRLTHRSRRAASIGGGVRDYPL